MKDEDDDVVVVGEAEVVLSGVGNLHEPVVDIGRYWP
jgi:hypothetical protein